MIREKFKMLVKELKQNKQQCLKIWNTLKEPKDIEEIFKFLKFPSYEIIKDRANSRCFKRLCMKLSKPAQQFEQDINIFLDSIVVDEPQSIANNSNVSLLKRKNIRGRQLVLNVYYDPSRLNIDYQYNEIRLDNLIRQYVTTQLENKIFLINSPKSSIYVLDGKRYIQNQYTEAYVFDPFFNCIIFQLKKQGLFTEDFMITQSSSIKINIKQNSNTSFWANDKSFSSDTSVQVFIGYICQKERADPLVKIRIIEDLHEHGVRFISDFLKFKEMKEISQLICKKKWACQILIEIAKFKSKKIKNAFQINKHNKQKLNCLKNAYSFKVFRYLFLKANKDDIQLLNTKLPYLDSKNVKEAIQIVKKDLIIDRLLDKIRQQCFSKYQKPMQKNNLNKLPNGILFYGPPGTGKTQLTEALTQLMGFHLVSNGLSSTTFMKQLVGGAKGAIQGYFIRANQSPHLICSLAIDQIDPLLMNRQQKEGNNSKEAISKFLAMMGGNQNVENLLVLGSTNHFNKIDDAMIRRFNSNFYVGLPSKEERRKILIKYISQLAYNQEIDLDYLIQITPNFSGAGLQLIAQRLQYPLKNRYKINRFYLLDMVDKVSKNLKQFFGYKTYPELLLESNLTMISSQQFFLRTYKNMAIFFRSEKRNYMGYFFKETQFNGKQISFKQLKFHKNSIPIADIITSKSLNQWVKLQKGTKLEIISQEQLMNPNFKKNSFSSNKIFLIQLQGQKGIQIIYHFFFQEELIPNLYVFFYTNCNKTSQTILSHFNNSIRNYTGRVLVDLSQSYLRSMDFQYYNQSNNNYQFQKKPFIKKNIPIINQEDYYPEIINELINKQLSYIQLIDNNFFAVSGIHQDDQCLRHIHQKIDEVKKYRKSGIVIDLDSIIKLNKSISHSQHGPSNSYSIDKPAIYNELINIMTKLATISNQNQNWMVVILKDQQLAKLVKKDIRWPLTAIQQMQKYEQDKKRKQEEEDKKVKVCKYCNQYFTEENNKKQKSCQQHYGEFIKISTCASIKDMSIETARFITKNYNMGKDKNQDLFLYSCCWKTIDEVGCKKMTHCADENGVTPQVELWKQQTQNQRQWLRKQMIQNKKRNNNENINRLQ